jgi:hypothetical protein
MGQVGKVSLAAYLNDGTGLGGRAERVPSVACRRIRHGVGAATRLRLAVP